LLRESIAIATPAVMLGVSWINIGTAQPASLSIEAAAVAYDSRTGEPVVSFRLTAAARRIFAEITRKNVGRRLAFLVGGRVVTTSVIREPIDGGSGQLSGGFTADQAKSLAARLSSGQSQVNVELAD
jgi:preprotein translocase subunit SecD